MAGFLIGDTGLSGKQFLYIFFLYLCDRSHKRLLVRALQQELFLFFLQFLLRSTRSGIKDLGQIYVLRSLIRGQEKAVAAVLIQVCLDLFQRLAVQRRPLHIFLFSCFRG